MTEAMWYGGYAVSCFVAAAIAKEWFGVEDGDDGPPVYAVCGLLWPVVVAFWCVVGVWVAVWWTVRTPIAMVGKWNRRRVDSLAEVEKLLRQ